MPKSPIDAFKRKTAHRLRSNATAAEAKLWRQLRQFETRGTHFRRQVPIGDFIADFACMAARVVIEVDGSQHGDGPGLLRDAERTRWLEAEGYRVLRFWNNEVTENLAGVLDVIHAALYGSRDADPRVLTHLRQPRTDVHPTPARSARRPSPSRGG
jgi:very-short-patch-repair endonuclease